jgi:hypothetical protein
MAVRLGLVVVLCLSLLGSTLVVPVAGAVPGQWLAQESPDRPGRSNEPAGDDGGGEPAPEPPAVEPPAPAPDEPEPPAPLPTEPEPDEPAAPPVVEPTPEPWGPARLQLYAPAFEQTVLDGSEATFTLEVAHLGAGGPDAKELWVDAPAGWGVRIAPAATGESLYDADFDGRPETRPLFVNDWTYVAVTITTPGTLDASGWATVRVRATSAVADWDAFRSWIDLTVTATVPPPSPEPVVEPPVDPSPSIEAGPPAPSMENSPASDAPASVDPESSDDALSSPEVDPSNGDADESGDPSPSGSGSNPVPSISGEPAASVEASGSADPSGSSQADASGSASPSASAEPSSSSALAVVSLPDGDPSALEPGESVTIEHEFAVDGLADDEEAMLALRADVWSGWNVELDTPSDPVTPAGVNADRVIVVRGDQVIPVSIQVQVPVNAVDGDRAMLTITGELLVDDPPAASNSVVAEDVENTDESADGPASGSAYRLSVVVPDELGLVVEGGANFGEVDVFGSVDPTAPGLSSVVDDDGATYTVAGAATLTVTGSGGDWEITCSALGSAAGGQPGRPLEWRTADAAWQQFTPTDQVCLRGTGPATIVLDLRMRVGWGDPIGTNSVSITFALEQVTS